MQVTHLYQEVKKLEKQKYVNSFFTKQKKNIKITDY